MHISVLELLFYYKMNWFVLESVENWTRTTALIKKNWGLTCGLLFMTSDLHTNFLNPTVPCGNFDAGSVLAFFFVLFVFRLHSCAAHWIISWIWLQTLSCIFNSFAQFLLTFVVLCLIQCILKRLLNPLSSFSLILCMHFVLLACCT